MIQTAIGGAQRPAHEIKTFNELYETSIWKMVVGFTNQEKRVDGEVAYVVRDMSDLVVGIMNFYELQNKRQR